MLFVLNEREIERERERDAIRDDMLKQDEIASKFRNGKLCSKRVQENK